MDPATYSLCGKAVIGAAMWISSLCAFPPPVPETPISLSYPGTVLTASFSTPVEKNYPLVLIFTFANVEERMKDQYVGSRYNEYCQGKRFDEVPERFREGLGKPIPLRVLIKRSDDGSVLIDKTFESLCTTGGKADTKNRIVGYLALPQGKFSIEILNLQPQPEFRSVKVTAMLAGGAGK